MDLTSLSDSALQRIGRNAQTGRLLQQAHVSIDASVKFPAVLPLLGTGHVEALLHAVSDLEKSSGIRSQSKAGALNATAAGTQTGLDLERFNHKAAASAKRLRRHGLPVPQGLTRLNASRHVRHKLRNEVRSKVDALPSLGLPEPFASQIAALVSEGRALLDADTNAAAGQQLALRSLPVGTADEYRLRGLVTVGIQMMYHAAQEAYAAQPEVARAFKPSLRPPRTRQPRKTQTAAASPQPAAAPAPAAAAASVPAASASAPVAPSESAAGSTSAAPTPAWSDNGKHALASA